MLKDDQTIGKCDFCQEEDVLVKKLYDNFDEWIMNRCYHDCDQDNRYDSGPGELFEIISIKKKEETLFYDSTWKIEVFFKNEPSKVKSFELIRLNGEQEEKLRAVIMKCKNFNEIGNLTMSIVYS